MAATHESAGIGTRKLTYEDLVTLPEDGRRYEILDGDLVVSASPVTRHQRVSRNLEFILHAHVRASGRGAVFDAPIDVVLDRHTVVVPDLVYVSKERASIVQPRGIVGAPDLVVEILSPATAERDRGAKAKLYARFGIDHYWVLDAEKETLTVFRREGDSYAPRGEYVGPVVVRAEPFAELELDLAAVWA